ncbi:MULTISPECIES: DUF397 domain-containing protein [unclassified Streptomyces]|uniref:DUF397 domain-containing protein n=1 Tax=unclassified Streptomyces TaxID=2593676 RepID=UPI000C275D82|nr:DUF397 domain-containing protein [Streptomyces sp. CB02959]PJN31675.1 DUF397 domain-containing protein [Streptomyces sp. CB02959]
MTAFEFRKSSYSGSQGECVEVACNIPHLAGAEWRKSNHSDKGGDCVEVADDTPGVIPVRDSKDPIGPHLTFGTAAWAAFIDDVKRGGAAIG